jgi:hypothetical protein
MRETGRKPYNTTPHTSPKAASHTSRRLMRPSSKRRHSTTTSPGAAAPTSKPQQHTPVPRPRPCEAGDLATQVTKVDTNEAKKKFRAAAPTSTPAPGPRTRLADEVDAERHGPKRADKTPDLQRQRPQEGNDDDVVDARETTISTFVSVRICFLSTNYFNFTFLSPFTQMMHR